MEGLARTLLILGGLLMAAGLVILLAARIGLPPGRLPGDLAWHGRHGSVFVPLGTSLLLSLILSVIFWILGSFRR
jgi:hypothetical protein